MLCPISLSAACAMASSFFSRETVTSPWLRPSETKSVCDLSSIAAAMLAAADRK